MRRYWPDLPDGVLAPSYSGVRPKIHGPGEAAPDFRIVVEPSATTGLRTPSQIMVDKPVTLHRRRIGNDGEWFFDARRIFSENPPNASGKKQQGSWQLESHAWFRCN